MNATDAGFWEPRNCFREPIKEIFFAQGLLDAAADAHVSGCKSLVELLLAKADIPAIGEWTQSIWGWGPNKEQIIRVRDVPGSTAPSSERVRDRMPSTATKQALIERDGWHCRFCGIPLIGKEARDAIRASYSLRWADSNKNSEQHWAFQCMWAQYDHLVPHARGGDSSLDNIVLTCAPCNFGRANYLLEEVGIIDPRTRSINRTDWDGLQRFIQRA